MCQPLGKTGVKSPNKFWNLKALNAISSFFQVFLEKKQSNIFQMNGYFIFLRLKPRQGKAPILSLPCYT